MSGKQGIGTVTNNPVSPVSPSSSPGKDAPKSSDQTSPSASDGEKTSDTPSTADRGGITHDSDGNVSGVDVDV